MTIDSIQLRDLRVIATIGKTAGFASAGRQLNLPRAAISRIVNQVEAQLGTRLFRRNTRKVVPTEAGETLIEVSARVLAELDASLGPVTEETGPLSGCISLSVSHALGRAFILPAIAQFRDDHPGVTLDISLDDRIDDLVEEAIDLTIRMGPLPETDVVARRLGAVEAGLFASADLIEKLGNPERPDQLGQLPAIGFKVPGTGRLLTWPGVEGQPLPRPSIVCNSIEAVADLAKAGHGVALLPTYLVSGPERARDLVRLFPQKIGTEIEVHLCYKERQFMPRRVRALIDHLAETLAGRIGRRA